MKTTLNSIKEKHKTIAGKCFFSNTSLVNTLQNLKNTKYYFNKVAGREPAVES